MAEWLGTGLQNQVQQFDSAWHLIKKAHIDVSFFYEVPSHPTASRSPSRGTCRNLSSLSLSQNPGGFVAPVLRTLRTLRHGAAAPCYSRSGAKGLSALHNIGIQKSPAFLSMMVGVYSSINVNLAHQEIPQCYEGNTCNHTDGNIPGESPNIATLQHHQRLLREGGESRKTATKAHCKE